MNAEDHREPHPATVLLISAAVIATTIALGALLAALEKAMGWPS